jgi:hypothetical protein
MVHFEYEAQNDQGKKIKGIIEAENKSHLVEMLEEMGYTPLRIMATKPPVRQRTYYYVGKDKYGKHVEGSIEASDTEDAYEKLNRMAYKDFRLSTRSNLDVPYDDTKADKAAKGIAALMIMAIFVATAIVTFSFPMYWEGVNLEENSRVTHGKIVDREQNSRLVQYSFEADGKQFKRYGYLDEKSEAEYRDGYTIHIRYSIKHPSISRIETGKLPTSASGKKLFFISAAVLLLAMLILFYCSAFHYIGRILKARAANKPIRINEVLRLLFNAISTLLFPMIFFCVFAMFQGKGKTSIYSPYMLYFLAGSIILGIIAIVLNLKKPIYYD